MPGGGSHAGGREPGRGDPVAPARPPGILPTFPAPGMIDASACELLWKCRAEQWPGGRGCRGPPRLLQKSMQGHHEGL